jgi:hypothetical protein
MKNPLANAFCILGALAFSMPASAYQAYDAKTSGVATLWRDRGDVASLNLLYGAGGKERQPTGKFTFVEEDKQGSAPKFEVVDDRGVTWKVKLGEETKSETAASRLVWAAGYFTDEDYYLPELKVEKMAKLSRGHELVSEGGVIHGARLERKIKGQKKTGNWSWFKNPFTGTKELNGLRVMMALINNWDLKDANNAIYERKSNGGAADAEQVYVISDLGATFGTTGFTMSVEASRGNLEAYKHSKFISNATPDYVDFGAPSRPTLIETFNLPVFVHRLDLRWIGRHIPRADAKWLGMVLGRLSPDQIRDAFRAAGYSPQEVNDFAFVVESRISALNAL